MGSQSNITETYLGQLQQALEVGGQGCEKKDEEQQEGSVCNMTLSSCGTLSTGGPATSTCPFPILTVSVDIFHCMVESMVAAGLRSEGVEEADADFIATARHVARVAVAASGGIGFV